MKIKRNAFFGSSIESLNIPARVSKIGVAITAGCDNLSSITVDPSNSFYKAENNCLIEKGQDKLIAGCCASVIPSDVKIIDQYAFERIDSLESITVPSNVETIEGGAFFMCSGLKKVDLSVGLKHFGSNTTNYNDDLCLSNEDDAIFYGCSSLENLVFPGGMETADGKYHLYYADSLKSISIPADFPDFEKLTYQFFEYNKMYSVTDVYFGGTKEQWTEIISDNSDSFDKNAPTLPDLCNNVTVHYGVEIPGDTKYQGEINPDNPDDPSSADADGVLKAAIAANKGAVTDTIGFTVDNSKKKPVYTVSSSQNGLAITVVKGSKFTIVGGEKKSFTSNSGNVKVSSKGVVSAKKAESKAEIKYKLQGETEPKTLYVTVIEPGLAKAENTNGEIKKLSLSAVTGNVIDATLAFPINATIGSVKGKTACVKDLKTEVSANGIHITGTADQKGNLTIPITATGKKYNVKIKVKASK